MAKREKIIVIIAAIFVLGFVANLFLSGDDGKKGKKAKGSEKTAVAAVSAEDSLKKIRDDIAESKETVGAMRPSELSMYVVANSDAAYPQDPFYFRAEAMEVQSQDTISEEQVGPSVELMYSGFIEIGRKRMAIINGLEYEVGDDVAGTGFLLRSVRPDWVEIESREGKYFLRIPFVEEGL